MAEIGYNIITKLMKFYARLCNFDNSSLMGQALQEMELHTSQGKMKRCRAVG